MEISTSIAAEILRQHNGKWSHSPEKGARSLNMTFKEVANSCLLFVCLISMMRVQNFDLGFF